MDNDHHNNSDSSQHTRMHFAPGFQIGATFHHVFRNINNALNQTLADAQNSAREDQTMEVTVEDLPHLDSAAARVAETPAPGLCATLICIDVGGRRHSARFRRAEEEKEQVEDDMDNDSMPELRSVSDSSESDSESVDVYSSHYHSQGPTSVGIFSSNATADGGATSASRQPVVEDDHDSAWTDVEDDFPPLEPITGSRRARVEDDVDDARDRRHPSERVGDSPSANENANPNASSRQQTRWQSPHGQNPFNFFGAPTNANAFTFGDQDHFVEHAGFAFTIPLGAVPMPHGNARPHANDDAGEHRGPTPVPDNGHTGNPPPPPGFDPNRPNIIDSFTALMQDWIFFSSPEGTNEDPERAKKLLAGLEVVPIGLVKRLERVGGAPGGHVGGVATSGTAHGCAICWDSLLDVESGEFGEKERTEEG
ncbi:hypothetical protein EDC04DRAFT_3093734, partial [Pisolithus marmoratus]